MSRNANLILAVEIFLLAFYAGSVFALARNSDDFILAKRQASLAPLERGHTVALGRPGPDDGILLGGWARESRGVRATTGRPELALKLPQGTAATLALTGRLTIPDASGQQLAVLLDGRPVASLAARGPVGDIACTWSLPLPAPDRDLSVLAFTGARPASPRELGLGPGTLRTAFALDTLTLAADAAPPACDRGGALTVSPD